jgi:hypothetical protein
LLHLTIRSPESDGPSESYLKRAIQPVQPASFQIDPIHAVMEVVSDVLATDVYSPLIALGALLVHR